MPTKKYKAFISYSHADEAFGKWLHKQLERYKIPKKLYSDYPNLPKSLYPIFRDRYELNAGDDLGVEIPKALENSEALIVVCSPNSADSKWVNQEIIDFKMMYGEERIFPIIIGGEPFAKESDKFEDSVECFPEALKYRVDSDGNLTNERTSVLASSTIEKEDGRELAKLKLIAGVLGIPFGEFYRRDEEQKRRDRNRNIGIWSFVFIFMAGLTAFSWIQRDKAEESTFINGMNNAILYRDYINNPMKAKLIFAKIATESRNQLQKEEAEISYKSINHIELKNILESNHSIEGVKFFQNMKKIIFWDASTIYVWNTDTDILETKMKHKNTINEVILKEYVDTYTVLSCSDDKSVKYWINGDLVFEITNSSIVKKALMSSFGSNILVWTEDNIIRIWDIKNEKIKFKTEHKNKINGISISSFNFLKDVLSYSDDTTAIFSNMVNDEKMILKHKKEVVGAIFSPLDNYILTWDKNKEVRLWSKETGKLLHSFKNKENIKKVMFSKSEKKIIAFTDRKIKLWDIKTHELIWSVEHGGNYAIFDVIFSLDEKYVISWSDTTIKLWDSKSGKLYSTLKHKAFVTGVKVSKSSEQILSWSSDNTVKLWNILTGETIFVLKHESDVLGAEFSDDEKKIISWSKKRIKIWKNKTTQFISNFNHGEWVNKVKFIKNETQLVSWGGDNPIKVWNIKDGKNIFSFKHKSQIRNVFFSNDEKFLLSLGFDNKLNLWNIETGEFLITVNQLIPMSETINNFIVVNDKLIIWFDTEIKITNIMIDEPIITFKHEDVVDVIISRDATNLISWDDNYLNDKLRINSRIRLWNMRTNNLIKVFFNLFPLGGVVFNKDETKIFSWDSPSSSLGMISLWDINSSTRLVDLSHGKGLTHAILSKDENKILSWGNDGILKLWNTQDQKLIMVIKHDFGIFGATFNKDGNKILSWSADNTIKLYNIKYKKPLFTLNHNGSVKGATFTKDEKRILSWSADGTVRLWSAIDGKLLYIFKYQDSQTGVSGARFTNDEKQILSWSRGNIKLLNLENNSSSKFNNYELESQIETGAYLTQSEEVNILNKEEWLKKKKKYEQILKDQK